MRNPVHRSNVGLFASVVLAVLILCQFLADQAWGFDPQGGLLALWIFSVGIIMLIYLAIQIDAIVRRVENDSRDFARDNIFSILPLIALIIGSLVRAIFYFLHTPVPAGRIAEKLTGWIFGFWTELEWMLVVLVVITSFIDLYQFANAANRMTAAARSESRTVS